MQLKSLLLPVLSLAAGLQATPVPLEARDTPIPSFTITKFYNYGRPHSVNSYLGFTVKNSATGQSADCSAVSQAQNIATAKFYTRCSKLGFGFGFEDHGSHYVWTVMQKYNKDTTVDTASVTVSKQKIKHFVNPQNPTSYYDYLDIGSRQTLYSNDDIGGHVDPGTIA